MRMNKQHLFLESTKKKTRIGDSSLIDPVRQPFDQPAFRLDGNDIRRNDVRIYPRHLFLLDTVNCRKKAKSGTKVHKPSTLAGNPGVPRPQQASRRSRSASRLLAWLLATIVHRRASSRSRVQPGVQNALGKLSPAAPAQTRASTRCDQVVRH